MNRKPVQSGALSEVGYDAETQTLEILFPSRALWRYHDVPPEIFARFIRAESLGRFFAADIRACFRAERVHDGDCTPACTDPLCRCWHHHHVVSKEIPNPDLGKDLRKSIKKVKRASK